MDDPANQRRLRSFSKRGITLKDIEDTIQDYHPSGFVLCNIQNNQFTWTYYPLDTIPDFRCKMLTDAIAELTQVISLPNVMFVVYISESFVLDENKAPVFTWCKHEVQGKRTVYFPDYEALNGNYNFLQEVHFGSHLYPWESKENLAFWRGAPTGGWGLSARENMMEYPRMKLVQEAKLFPHLIDAKLSGFFPGQDQSILLPFLGNSLSVTEHLRYKYQILVDGHVSAFSRAYWELFSNCVIFKQESPWSQWFYRELRPYIHYIPYEADATDLIEKLVWAIRNDEICHQISKNANDFANNNLKHSDVMLYVYLLLKEYAKLQRF